MAAIRRGTQFSRRRLVGGASLVGLGLMAGCGRLPGQAAPPSRVPQVGYLASTTIAASGDLIEPFRQALGELGWVDGQNVALVIRAAENQPARFREIADEFVRLPVDLIVAVGTPGALAAKEASSAIPIVTIAAGDPVGSGLAASYARPGGNVTGMSQSGPLLAAKRVEFLKEVQPSVISVAALSNPSNPANAREWEETQEASRVLGVQPRVLEVRDADALVTALEVARQQRPDGLIVFADPVLNGAHAIAEFAAETRVPAVYGWKAHTGWGGLMAYGPDPRQLARRAAYFVDRILRGAKPADLPVEQPREFDFVINMRTADALGLAIPQHILLQATEVIQ